MSNKLLVAGVAIAAAASSAHAAETHPFVEPVVTGDVAFLETFSDGLGSWSGSKNDKYNGVPVVTAAKHTEDQGLFVDTEARHYGVSSLLKEPFDPSEGLVVQYEAALQEGLECGGAYLKFLNTDEKAFTPDTLDGDSPYTLMFGPDRCGGTDKVHVIFRHASLKTGAIEEKHLADPPRMPGDKLPHLYGLEVTPAGDLTVKIDGEAVFEGSLFDDGAFDPPFVPPKEIDDPTDEKPADWVDEPMIEDPDAKKPDDWDEDAPSMIPDMDATKPEGWLDDEPLTVDDPDATQPEDWDEDEDGTWEAPTIDNPKCAEAPGCGEWERPTKYNPDYKGNWYPPRIDNPDYKGLWEPRKIPNPEHYVDDAPLTRVGKIGAVALEVWTMSKGLVVDNVLVAKDGVAAGELEQVWRPKFDFLKKIADEEEKTKFDDEAAMDTPSFFSRAKDTVADVLFAAAGALPEGAARDRANAFVTSLAESAVSLFSFVALLVLLVLLAVSSLFGGEDAPAEKEKAKKAAGKKKKTDAPEPDDEPEEEAEEEEEEEEEEPVKSPSTRRRAARK